MNNNKTGKGNIQNPNHFFSVALSIASEKDVREWSHGEITNPETINYKTYKPEKNGLFDELIFGPIVDYKCPICGTKYKRSNEGQICEKLDDCKMYRPEILPSIVRRKRMAHIQLASPVVHFWFFKIDHSIIAKILGLRVEGVKKTLSKTAIEDIIYFKSHIVLEDGGLKSLPKNEIIEINRAAIVYRNAFHEIREKYKVGSTEYDEITFAIEELEETATSKIGKDYGIDFYELNEIISEYSEARIGTGAKAIEHLLGQLDVKAEIKRLKVQIAKMTKDIAGSEDGSSLGKTEPRSKLYKRLEVLNAFASSGQDPRSMLIYSLPVIPADLRPLVQIDGGRHSTTDVNELYRRIIIRNNRLKKWMELEAPILIVQNELRMLQEAVDALIDNSRKKPSPVLSKDNRPFKSIADALSGKKGRFRQNLLGKRVDYSGRSVIVVGPELKMHQAGIPREMAAKLFEPWIIRKLMEYNVAPSIKAAKKMIENQDNVIWPYVEKTIEGQIVLINRAPTLHRLSIQAFEPVLVRGKAIRLHPLVTTAFNADFDGDQMAVHVPISPVAVREARELMIASRNILGPKDGEPIINPSQDMILGLFYLTKEVANVKGEGHYFATYDELVKAYELGFVSIHARIALPTEAVKKLSLQNERGYVVSTVGKFIFNASFPQNFPFIFDNSPQTLREVPRAFVAAPGTDLPKFIADLPLAKPLAKRDIAKIVRRVFDFYTALATKRDIAGVIANVNAKNAHDMIMEYAELTDVNKVRLNRVHCELLSQFTREAFREINSRIMMANEGVERYFEVGERVELLEKVWFKYTNVVAEVLDNIKNLGFRFSTVSGVTMSIDDIKVAKNKDELVKEGEQFAIEVKDMANRGLLTDDERYQLVIKKWSEVKEKVQKDIKSQVGSYPDNSIFMMMESGARGSISNFVQLAGMRGLMANNKKQNKALMLNNIVVRSTVEVPVKSSFLEGLTAYEFYSSTHGARKGLTDIALNTANAGYLTRRLVDMSQNIVVREEDCGTSVSTYVKDIVDTKTKTIIIPLRERIEGRFAAEDIKGPNGKLLIKANELVTPEIAAEVVKHHEGVRIRSVFGCQTPHGVCKKCYGRDLSTNRIVEIGEAVGVIAAQSIGEPGTQLTMRTFHTGGVAGVEDITGGFDRLKQLIDATKKPWEKPAIISKTKGTVMSIDRVKDTKNELLDQVVVTVEASSATKKLYKYEFDSNRRLRVKVGDVLNAGQKIVDGPIQLEELLELAGISAVQLYLLKEIQRLYRMQGITISDKYTEIIVRQMLSKVLIKDPGASSFFAGSLVDINNFKAENKKLLAKGKKPAYGSLVIKGSKQIPLLSDSFLAAASYQETAKVLVHAAIRAQKDNMHGLKENIITGHRIPAGTGNDYEVNGKYDIRDSYEYFGASSPVVLPDPETEK